MNRNTSTAETQLLTSTKNDQEVKSDEDSQNKIINIEITDNNQAKTSEESKIEVAEDGKTKSSEPIGISNELEQGSEINLNNLENLKLHESVSLTLSHKKSILKLRKNVSFNLQRNQIKIIF